MLLVEAEVSVMQRMAWILLEAGFVTARVESHDDADRTLIEYDPDVVVINNDLPEAVKRGCIDRFRYGRPRLRILDVHSAAYDASGAHDAGADDVLHMPFDAEDLIGKVRDLARRA
ncbi:MAG TPA: response regulator [Dehalococcoidia bacterium]|nr:response regulator [Dehalococcoidia bacterium]